MLALPERARPLLFALLDLASSLSRSLTPWLEGNGVCIVLALDRGPGGVRTALYSRLPVELLQELLPACYEVEGPTAHAELHELSEVEHVGDAEHRLEISNDRVRNSLAAGVDEAGGCDRRLRTRADHQLLLLLEAPANDGALPEKRLLFDLRSIFQVCGTLLLPSRRRCKIVLLLRISPGFVDEVTVFVPVVDAGILTIIEGHGTRAPLAVELVLVEHGFGVVEGGVLAGRAAASRLSSRLTLIPTRLDHLLVLF